MPSSHQRIAVLLAALCISPLPVAVAVDRGHTADATPKARIYGCPMEDSCSIDYRPSGVWVITRR